MSRPPGHPQLRARLIAALEDLLRDQHHTQIGAILDCAGTTITRRGPDLTAWPLSDVLKLAIDLPADELRQALATCLLGEDAEGRPALAVPDSFGAIQQLLALGQSLSAAVADNRVDAAEAAGLVPVIQALISELAKLLTTMRDIAEQAS